MISVSARRPAVLTLLAAFVVSLVSGCGEKSQSAASGNGSGGGGKRGGGGPAPVLVGQVQRKVVPLVVEAIGAVEPIRTTAVRSQITGTLMKIAIQEGQDVRQGDLLFEIDPRPFQNALQSALADREKIRVQLENARAQVARYKTLTEGQMVSKEQFQKIQDDERALTAQSLSSDAAVANAKLQLEYCSIRAPLGGRTGNISVHEGDLIRATAADSANPLVTINQLSPIYVTFGVPQQYLSAITRYRAAGRLMVRVVPPGGDEKSEEGELTFLDNTVDSATGTIKLKGTFPNERNRLWPGQFVTVSMFLASPEVLAIASSAIQTSQTGQNVFVVKADKTAEFRPVIVERTYENDAVITKGLEEGEVVVIDGQLRVISGRPVDIKDPTGGGTGRAKGGGKGGKGKGAGKEVKETKDGDTAAGSGDGEASSSKVKKDKKET